MSGNLMRDDDLSKQSWYTVFTKQKSECHGYWLGKWYEINVDFVVFQEAQISPRNSTISHPDYNIIILESNETRPRLLTPTPSPESGYFS